MGERILLSLGKDSYFRAKARLQYFWCLYSNAEYLAKISIGFEIFRTGIPSYRAGKWVIFEIETMKYGIFPSPNGVLF